MYFPDGANDRSCIESDECLNLRSKYIPENISMNAERRIVTYTCSGWNAKADCYSSAMALDSDRDTFTFENYNPMPTILDYA